MLCPPDPSRRARQAGRTLGNGDWAGPLGGGQDRLDDLVVAGAAAEVAHHPLLHFELGGVGILGQQRGGGHNLAWGADAALEPAVADEGVLQWGERPTLGGEALD